MEAASLTAPRPGRIQADAFDGFGCRSEETITVEAALTSWEATWKESTGSGQALRRPPQQIYLAETAAACCCYCGGEGAPPTFEHTSHDKETIKV